MVNYADDCIHLKACRRMTKLQKASGCFIGRKCGPETCTAYDGGAYVSVQTAVEYARSGAEQIKGGYDSYDVYCDFDLTRELP